MHEVSLVSDLIEQVETIARAQNSDRVLSVRVEIGDWSGVDRSAVEFCFPELVRGTLLEGSRLDVRELPVQLRCLECQKESQLPQPTELLCPYCHATQVQVVGGKEFILKEIEVA
jgi:hydrogenase nickel incorporation protein HypA/HybF